MSKDGDVAVPAFHEIAQQFTIEGTAKAHKEVIERIKNQVHVQTRKAAKELELSVKNLEKDFQKVGIIEQDATAAKVLHHKRSIEKLEARLVNISLMSSGAEKHRSGAWDHQTRRHDSDLQKNFYRMFESDAASLMTSKERTDNMAKPKRKKKLHKIRKFMGLLTEKLSTESLAKQSLSKESKLPRDALPTRKARTPHEGKNQRRSRSCPREETLSISRQRRPKNEEEPAQRKEKAKTLTKRPWYKFWQK